MNDYDRDQEIDATVTIEENHEANLVSVTEPLRHPLLAEKKKNKKFIKEVKKEIDIDIKLGLDPKETAQKALEKDIDELTNSRDYQEISKNELKQLFQINWVNLIYCSPYNLVQRIKALSKILFGTFECKVFASLSACFVPLAIMGYAAATWSATNRWDTLFNTAIFASFVGAVVFTVFWLGNAFHFRFETSEDSEERPTSFNDGYERDKWRDKQREKEKDTRRVVTFRTINVSLDIRPLMETDIDVPRGAKFKVAEAMDTKIFEAFVIATPKFDVTKHQIEIKEKIIPRMTLDPAICGVTADKRLFLIVCWDKKKDIYGIKRSIARFKKYKLEV